MLMLMTSDGGVVACHSLHLVPAINTAQGRMRVEFPDLCWRWEAPCTAFSNNGCGNRREEWSLGMKRHAQQGVQKKSKRNMERRKRKRKRKRKC